ncbi:MAG: hypothetical protein JSR80_07850 [Verrucomicrobia bacterium]|nr:hypothetical protein [Verrucomicrobiota bacterium]
MEERPLECSECKKSIAVHYTTVVGGKLVETDMCSSCPVLQRKLHGVKNTEPTTGKSTTGLACGSCGTTLEALQTGSPVGCAECYNVFADVIFFEMNSNKRLSKRSGARPKSGPLHIGRAPGEIPKVSPSIKLVALDEALEATIKGEDYEGAAWLRDQIKAVKEHLNEP